MINIKNKKVSLLICFYERPNFIDLMIHNIVNQTFFKKYKENLEIVIIDDSHEMYTLDIKYFITELSKYHFDNVNYIRINDKKLTIGKKRNLLCDNANHPILIFMDDDDYYFPSYIEYSVTELIKKRKVMVGSNSMLFCFTEHDFLKRSINCISPRQMHEATACFLKSFYKQTGGFNTNGFGEGASMIDGNEHKVNAKMDISKIMVCVCHPKNSCNKNLFINNGMLADYNIPEEAIKCIKKATSDPMFIARKRIVFKYPTRGRPEIFKKLIEKYIEYSSGIHEYRFVISIDIDDKTMNNEEMISYIEKLRERVVLEYYIEPSKNKVDALNRNIRAARGDVLVLVSDDMVPIEKNYDDIIIKDFEKYYPDYDGMLNYNDGLRKDWPKLCTLTVYGWKYYSRFNYIYNPEYKSVFCDNEQTDVGRLLNKITDIDRVIIRHEWTNVEFQDELRRKNEQSEYYQMDKSVYERRKRTNFGLQLNNIANTNEVLLSILIPTIPSRLTSFKRLYDLLESQLDDDNKKSVEILALFDNKIQTIGRKRTSLLRSSKGQFFTFIDDDDLVTDDYITQILNTIRTYPHIDVITFKQQCSLDDGKTTFVVDSNLETKVDENIPFNGPWKNEYKRSVWHWNVFRKSEKTDIDFTDRTGYEDQMWLKVVRPKLTSQVNIPKILYLYTFSINTTEGQYYLREVEKEKNTENTVMKIKDKEIIDYVFVTACDSNYFESCLTLISSIHSLSYDNVDKIIVYDLGLQQKQKDILSVLEKVTCVHLEETVDYLRQNNCLSEHFMEPKQFAWKPYVFVHSRKFGRYVFYLDSGCVLLKNIEPIYARIKKMGTWLTLDPDHINRTWTHPTCSNILNATKNELDSNQLLAGVTGYDTQNIQVCAFFDEVFNYAKNKDCITGIHHTDIYGKDIKGHRHDQSIMSILINRYKLPTISKTMFLEWTNIDLAIKKQHTVFVHHGKYINIRQLLKKQTEHINLTSLDNLRIPEREIIQSDKILQFCEQSKIPNLSYRKTEFLYNEGKWRGKDIVVPDYTIKEHVIVSGHSGYDIDNTRYNHVIQQIKIANGSLRRWFAQNPSTDNTSTMMRLPLGISNNCDDSKLHRVLGDTSMMTNKNKCLKAIENILYLNYNNDTHLERSLIKKRFEEFQWVTCPTIDYSLEGRNKYINDIYHHMFQLCPSGTGNDTHRLWETLYMKCVPIVKNNSVYYEFKDLPILYIDNFEDVTDNILLIIEYERIIQNRMYNLQKLTTTYWLNLIQKTCVIDDNTLNSYCKIKPNTHRELYTDYEKSLKFLNTIEHDLYKHPRKKYNFHIYSELVDENQLMALQSYLATQDLDYTVLHVWSEYDITNTYNMIPYKNHPNINFHVYDPHELAIGTPLENRDDILSLNDHKFYLKSDIFRLLALYKYGGCFYDHDVVLMNDFKPLMHFDFAYTWGSELEFNKEGFCATVIGVHTIKNNNIYKMIEEITRIPKEYIREASTVFGKDMFARVYSKLEEFYILPSAWFNTEWSVNQKTKGLSVEIQKTWFDQPLKEEHLFPEAFSWHYHNGTKKNTPTHDNSKMSILKNNIYEKLRARNIGKTVFLGHLGLGDHIICNSIIRCLYKISPYVCVVVKVKNLENVKRMYSDLDYLKFIPIVNDYEMSLNKALYPGDNSKRMKFEKNKYTIIDVGNHCYNYEKFSPCFVQEFYKHVKLPLSIMKSKFHVPINEYNEQTIFNNYGRQKNSYIVIHDNPERNYVIQREHILNNSLPIIDLSSPEMKKYSLFDMRLLLENALEIHVIDSSFLWFINNADIGINKRYFHNYVKKKIGYIMTDIMSCDWKIIE